jgi:4-carboxymuconolactone decarboxylase
MDELRRKGLAKMNEVYGWEMPNIEGNPYFDLTVDHLFGTIWTRPGLSMRQADHDADRGGLAGHRRPRRDPGQRRAAQRGTHRRRTQGDGDLLTHYLGFPLGSKFDGAVGRVVAKRAKAAEKGQAEDKKETSMPP